MKSMKRTMSIVVCFVLLLALAVPAFAATSNSFSLVKYGYTCNGTLTASSGAASASLSATRNEGSAILTNLKTTVSVTAYNNGSIVGQGSNSSAGSVSVYVSTYCAHYSAYGNYWFCDSKIKSDLYVSR